MPVRKLETVDAFVLSDFADVPASGYVRRARKILQSSTWDMARSATYCFASFDVQRSGASAGINAPDDGADDAVRKFRSELNTESESGRLRLLAGKGVEASATDHDDGPLAAATTLGAVEWALGAGLEGRTVAIETAKGAPTPEWLRLGLTDRGAILVDVDGVDEKPWLIWGADADVLLVGSKPGAMNHQGAEMVNAGAVVPWGPIPITTKALAVLSKRGVTYVPDFISAAGPLLGGLASASDPSSVADHVTRVLSEAAQESGIDDKPLFLACCRRAERFLQSWQRTLPFGRPLAG